MKLQVKRRQPRIEIVPMIDVLCFLLIFFFLFSTLKEAQTGVEVNLPKTVHLGQTEQTTVVISIDANSQIFYGEDPVGITELQYRVGKSMQRDRTTRFIVKPDAVVPYQAIIEVTDILASQGVDKPLWGVDRQKMPKTAAAGSR
jgi:biopolymer transport protein ExbD